MLRGESIPVYRSIPLRIALAAGILVAGCTSKPQGGDTLPVSSTTVPVAACALQPVDAHELGVLDGLTHRIDTAVEDKRLMFDYKIEPDGSIDSKDADRKKFLAKSQIAAENGLTLYDAWSEVYKLDWHGSAETALNVANKYFEQLGIRVTLERSKHLDSTGTMEIAPVDQSQIDGDPTDLIGALQSLMLTNGDIPAELVKSTGLKEIRLVGGIKQVDGAAKDNTVIAGLAEPQNQVYFASMSVNAVDQTETFQHEFGHMLDHAYTMRFHCSEFDDPQFNSLNPPGITYGQTHYDPRYIAEDMYNQKKTPTRAVFDRMYATTNVAEDKAVTDEPIHNDVISLERDSRVLDRKIAILLERADALAPGYLKYRLALTGRLAG